MRKAESRLDHAFQGMFKKRSNVNVRPIELAWKLVKEMEDNKLPSASRVYVPNEYAVYLCAVDYTRFEPYRESLARQLQNHLLHHARKNAYSMVGAPAVTVERDADLRSGEYGIGSQKISPLAPGLEGGPKESAAAAAVAGAAPSGIPRTDAAPRRAPVSAASVPAPLPVPAQRAATAGHVVLVQGRHSQEFASPRVVLGRGSEADYRLDDPNVSRRHAVIAWENGGLYLRDLGSTNGTYLNGRSVNSASIRNGDVITLGESQITVETG